MRLINYRPPRIATLLLVTAAIIHLLIPVQEIFMFSYPLTGIIMGVTGFIIMMWGWALFKRHDTAICPTAATTSSITEGIYRVTRNPMYLGICLMMLGIALYTGSPPFYFSAVIFFIVINTFFCPYEEQKLATIFKDQYLEYTNIVRRWI